MKAFVVIILILIILVIVFSVGLYEFTFVHRMNKRFDPLVMTDSDKEYYGTFTDEMLASSKRMLDTKSKHVFIKTEDNLKLNGHLYDQFENRPVVIFFHGYHASYLRDGYGTFRYCMAHNLNLLMIEQRAHCKSDGNVISFGINERKDACLWVNYVKEIFPKDTKIILAGVSMGAATVMMASELLDSDDQILCYIEDCGYTSPKEIIINTAKDMGFPTTICYPLAKIAAKLLGKFDVEAAAAIDAVAKISKPMLFIHGTEDTFVPTHMCKLLYDACTSKNKKIKHIDGARHALAALVGYEEYEEAIDAFFKSVDESLV